MSSKVDWSKAPEWATHVLIRGYKSEWAMAIDGGRYAWHGSKPGEGFVMGDGNWSVLEERPSADQVCCFPAIKSFAGQKIGDKNKYAREIKPGVFVDVYDVLEAFRNENTNSAIEHAVKKLLATGGRGHKDAMQDIREAIESLKRAVQIEHERGCKNGES